jgi:hypothetical protein
MRARTRPCANRRAESTREAAKRIGAPPIAAKRHASAAKAHQFV